MQKNQDKSAVRPNENAARALRAPGPAPLADARSGAIAGAQRRYLAGLAKAKVAHSQAQLQLRSMELSVATQVREVARTLSTNRKRVDATRASRSLAEKKLEAEQKKFQAGMSTNFQVIQAQRDLAAARNAELQAVLDYMRSLVDFDTVQQAPVGASSTSSTATAAR